MITALLKRAVLTVIPGLVLLIAPGTARAGLEVCNDTQATQAVAIGYKEDGYWVSEGWWSLDAGVCKTPVQGDLKNRYYYYLSKSNGWEFADDNISFCTDSDVFTIIGDQDCIKRGFDKSLFRKIDTGKTAKQYTQFLAAFTEPTANAPAPSQTTESGKWGEPYSSGTAIFQNCIIETEEPFCTFHADGYKFFVYDDDRTPPEVMERLYSYQQGTPIDVQGDLTEVHDITADVVLRQVLPRLWNTWDTALNRMQGQWYSDGDRDSKFTVFGAEKINTYQGEYMGLEYLTMGNNCNGYEDGPYLIVTDETLNDALCYTIEDMDDRSMTWMYLPRANFHRFIRLE